MQLKEPLARHWKYLGFGGLAGIAVGAGFCVLLYYLSGVGSIVDAKFARDACRKQYPYTSRTIGCLTYDDNADTMHALDAQLDQAADVYIKEGKAKRVSVFVRNLVTQQWAAANENEVYAPASLMKLPLLIAYYKVSEVDPTIFSSHLVYDKSKKFSDNSEQDYVPADKIVIGNTYTVDQLIEHMMINSDNAAADVLYAHVNPDIFSKTAVDMGITIPTQDASVDFVTAKTYAGIYRILYNASYLNRDSSEKALALMTKSTFPGIAASLPTSVKVAHKFGEREIENVDGSPATRQLHDCGIVYKATDPYIICIMTEGKNFADLLSILQGVSSLVYQNI